MNRICYIQLILPLKLGWEPWYSSNEPLSVGQRVYARLMGRLYVAVVHRIADCPDIPLDKVRSIEKPITEIAPVSVPELELWQFISSYYLCSIGEVYKAAYPAGKTRSETDAVLTVKRLESLVDAKRELIVKLESRKKPNAALISHHRAILERHLAMMAVVSRNNREFAKPARNPESAVKTLLSVSSDNTLKYIDAVRTALESGNSALILVPQNIASERLSGMLYSEFGERLVVHNSEMSPARRRDLMHLLRYSDEAVVVLGTRSSIFLPFRNLSLVIVDDEQNPLFKQSEPSPRYNARDAAAMLAHIHGANLIMGSCCPSMESLYNTVNGKFQLDFHPLGTEIELVDFPAEKRKRGVCGAFSYRALDCIRNASGPVLLVRGYETEEQLMAQKEELGLDCDVMTTSAAYNAERQYEVIVMLSADAMSIPDDFRSDEKALQTLSVLSSHCRRLVIQCSNPEHPVYGLLCSHELPYALLQERKQFRLPPYSRIVDIKGSRGNLFRRIVLDRGPDLADAKQDIYRQYCSTNIIDVDPL